MPPRRPAVLRPAVLAAWIPIFAFHVGLGSVPARGAETEPVSRGEPQAQLGSASSSSFPAIADRCSPSRRAGPRPRRVTAILFRREANDRYDAYQQTADPAAIDDLYAESKHLDQVATGFFIGPRPCSWR